MTITGSVGDCSASMLVLDTGSASRADLTPTNSLDSGSTTAMQMGFTIAAAGQKMSLATRCGQRPSGQGSTLKACFPTRPLQRTKLSVAAVSVFLPCCCFLHVKSNLNDKLSGIPML